MTAFVICATVVTVSTLRRFAGYEATAQILIDKESTNVVTFKQAVEQNQTTDDYYQTQYRDAAEPGACAAHDRVRQAVEPSRPQPEAGRVVHIRKAIGGAVAVDDGMVQRGAAHRRRRSADGRPMKP